MVIWSAVLNGLTEPLADVQCETPARGSNPWVCAVNAAATIGHHGSLGHACINETSRF